MARSPHPAARGAEAIARTRVERACGPSEAEVSEHVARAKATHPKGEVRWRGALILPHEGAEARTRGERACGPCESDSPKG